jgi:biopolymer transport protein ExbD
MTQQKGVSPAKFKALLRKETRRRAHPHEANFLNITAMMDMMTIILVFLLKSLSSSSANLPQTSDLALPSSLLDGEPATEGIQIVVSADRILVNGNELKGVEVPKCFQSAAQQPKPNENYRLAFCAGDSQGGFDKKFKARGKAEDIEITPLLNALENPVKVAEEVAKQKKKKGVEAMVVFDRYTSFRVMTEVMFTLMQAKISKFHFLALSGAKK